MSPAPYDRIPDAISPAKSLEPTKVSPEPSSSQFRSMMDTGPKAAPSQQMAPSSSPTPMEITRSPLASTGQPSFQTLLAQAKVAQDGLGTVESQLKKDKLTLTRSQNHLIKNKLKNANEHIASAASKMGLEPKAMAHGSGESTVAKFLGYVNHGQDTMLEVQQMIESMGKRGGAMSAGDMLSIQVKIGLAQQEIEYASTLLGKAIEGVKTILNVQL